ncbi:putative nucleotide-diphospho-sugar transferase [Tranquillimonas alkanivorans]|uniref:Nucleotide-diphospho-sugar transferase n=1 Tax=Tranquillimonas alkanivorans TaxID=441119 RepID=A0A1I5Q8D8_9RHOB|nr:putative nucleotide-diphospho-sugar transferase [Tranquillimonas alkanivorans]SFP42533.1 Nucleotide-diphospho-sugar transferase [Tranquillimonas alkanivorans]
MTDGVLYVAKGADYLDLAEQSARSLKAHNPHVPVDIFTDRAPVSGIFDRVHTIPAGRSPKLASLGRSRFTRTLYLDCDTLVCAPLADLFEVVERFDLAVAHDVRRTSGLIQQSHSERPPYAFPQMNAGVLLYRSSATVLAFLAEWQSRHAEAGHARDQITFRDLLWSSDLRFYVLPPEFNLRRVTVLDAWEPLDARPTIIHSHRLLQHLRGHDERLTDLAAILAAEREALAEEWAASGICPTDNPAERFHLAERFAPQDVAPKAPAKPKAPLKQPAE